jgi:dTMP kinase
MIATEPALTLLIDIDPATGLSRAVAPRTSERRFEDMGLAMQSAMRAGFLALAQANPARFAVIDGARPPEAVAEDILRIALARLPR